MESKWQILGFVTGGQTRSGCPLHEWTASERSGGLRVCGDMDLRVSNERAAD
jgi:hypothetical protein